MKKSLASRTLIVIQSLWSFRGRRICGDRTRDRGRCSATWILEARVRKDHPLRPIRAFGGRGARGDGERVLQGCIRGLGRPSIAPEKLLRAMLLQAFYSIRSERQLMERLEFDLLFRWFVGLGIDDVVWDHSTFSKNRDRLLDGDVGSAVPGRGARPAAGEAAPIERSFQRRRHAHRGLGIKMKSVKPKEASSGGSDLSHRPPNDGGRNAESGLQGARSVSNETHASTTDPDARLYRKGPGMETRLAFMGHTLMENRSGLLVDRASDAGFGPCGTGRGAGDDSRARADRPRAITLGADRGYDAEDFVNELRAMNVRPLCRSEPDPAWRIGNRWTHDPPPWICREPAHPETHRGRFRLDEDGFCRPRPPDGARYRPGRLGRSPSLRLLTISCASPSLLAETR